MAVAPFFYMGINTPVSISHLLMRLPSESPNGEKVALYPDQLADVGTIEPASLAMR